jgi:hypothetical protein
VALELILEVHAHAPSDLDSGEFVALLVLAELARGPAREWAGPQEEFACGCRMRRAGLREVLQRLARRNLDVRVPIGADRRGRPLYAVPGRSPTFRLVKPGDVV